MFTLRVTITLAHIKTIKTDLARLLPYVKASHRIEAVARAFGFKTYASFVAQLGVSKKLEVTVEWPPFHKFLELRNYNVSVKQLFIAMAGVALKEVGEKMPNLTDFGIGIFRPALNPDGSRMTMEQRREKFTKCRGALFDDSAREQFLASLAFVQRVNMIKTTNRSISSYGLKHIAEEFSSIYPNGESLGPIYVSNGPFIAAAVHEGFRAFVPPDWPNVMFNMSKRSIAELQSQVERRRRAA